MAREHRHRPRCVDVRLCGFSERASLAEAVAWVDAHAALRAEAIAGEDACGRILHEPLAAGADVPACDRAAIDGYAVRSRETIGAGAYNPIPFTLQASDAPLAASAAALVDAGAMLPHGADAVLPFAAAHRTGPLVEAVAAVAEGVGVERRGDDLRGGVSILDAGRELRAQDLAILAAVGIERVQVVRRPRVRIVVAGPKPPGGPSRRESNGPMLRALVARDGGQADMIRLPPAGAELAGSIARALHAPGADAILVVGRTGTGADDEAPLALAHAGELAIHGVALRPGGSAGMGRVAVPIVLLPGAPLACLCAYELLAGRLVRRLAGRDPQLPHAVRQAEVRRKLVSMVGFVDVCQVRLVDGGVEPLGSVEEVGLAAAVQADGFVVIPGPLEGHAPGARVDVHLYGDWPAPGGTRESSR